MATKYDELEISPELISMLFAAYCNNVDCGSCEIKSICDKAFGMGSGCFEKEWLEWLQEECDANAR